MPFLEKHPQHVLKFCPRCGSKNFPAQQPHHFVCQDCDFQWYINAASCTAAILTNPHGKVLLGKRKYDPGKGLLDLPGGFADLMETAEECIHREVYEEIQQPAKNLRYFRSYPNQYEYNGVVYFTLDLSFIGEIENWEAIQPADDIEALEWIAPHDIDLSQIAFPSLRQTLSDYLETL